MLEEDSSEVVFKAIKMNIAVADENSFNLTSTESSVSTWEQECK